MPGIDPLKRITLLYHFTDRRNLPNIRKHGGLYPRRSLQKNRLKFLLRAEMTGVAMPTE